MKSSSTVHAEPQESAMKPTKEQVRSWLMSRAKNKGPLPSCEEIRRQLGWTAQFDNSDCANGARNLTAAMRVPDFEIPSTGKQ